MEKHTSKLKRNLATLLLFVIPFLSFAQTKLVTGTVISAEDGLGIPGVNILIKGTSTGTVTDLDGHYSIEIPKSPATLIYSMVGMLSQEKPVRYGEKINLSMKSDEYQLEQVIVTGYTSQRKADLTGAVSVAPVSDMMSAAENNPIKALQGRVAGMNVTADGNPSGSATIRIRGVGTLNNNDPLFVIDGVPTRGGMHELNSNDIETIQVLKDASSASIYGSRAANGVIIITTKKGKKGKTKLTFDAYVTQSWYNNRQEVLNAKEYGEAQWLSAVNSGINPSDNSFGYQYNWGYNELGDPVLYNSTLPKFLDTKHTMQTSDTDWFNEVSKKGLIQSYNMSVSNGTDNGNYFFSLGYYNNDGTIKESDFNRISVRMNSDYKLFDGIVTIGENFTLNRTTEVQAPADVLDMALKSLPLIPVHTIDGKGWGGPTPGMNDRQNPVRILDDNKDNGFQFWRIFGNAYLNIEPIKGLNLRSNFGVDYGNFFKRKMLHSFVSGMLNSDKSAVTLEQGHWMKWTWSNTVSYAKTIDEHQFDVLGGMEMNYESNINFTSYKEDFLVQTPEQMWPDMGIGKSNSTGNKTAFSLLSYFGKVNYAYDNRYLASATVRYDGSSRFGANNRFAMFPAFSVGWRVSEEAFMESTRNVISDLKLRAAWGQTGNQEIDNVAIYTLYVTDYGTADPTWNPINGTAYDIEGSGSGMLPSGYKRTRIGNPDLKWETTTQTNIGLDFSLFDQQLYGSAEIYLKQTDDILVEPPYLGVIGEGGRKWYNGAAMENKGYEVSLGYRNNTAFGLAYDISANISGYRNKITKLPKEVENAYGGNGKGENILGRPLGSFYGYVADGLFRSEDEVDAHVEQEGKGLGRIRYKNLNGDQVINEDDRMWIGSPHPDFMYGLNVNLEYKGFDLSIFLQGVQGIDINTQAVKSQTDFWSVNDVRSNKGTRLLKAWSKTNSDSDIPALQSLNINDEGRFSTYFIENGSYLKLRNLQLGYTLPQTLSKKAMMERVRFYVSGQNLFTLKSKSFSGVDPENPGFGYPIPITFTAGLNITF